MLDADIPGCHVLFDVNEEGLISYWNSPFTRVRDIDGNLYSLPYLMNFTYKHEPYTYDLEKIYKWTFKNGYLSKEFICDYTKHGRADDFKTADMWETQFPGTDLGVVELGSDYYIFDGKSFVCNESIPEDLLFQHLLARRADVLIYDENSSFYSFDDAFYAVDYNKFDYKQIFSSNDIGIIKTEIRKGHGTAMFAGVRKSDNIHFIGEVDMQGYIKVIKEMEPGDEIGGFAVIQDQR